MNLKDVFAKRLKQVKSNISNVNISHGNEDVTLVAVTKYSEICDLIIAYESGQVDFGENKVQVLEEKAIEFSSRGLKGVNWHFIGNLQSNKVSKLLKVPNLVSIHSISSRKLLELIYKKQDLFDGEQLSLFLEVNASGESQKHGFNSSEEVLEAINSVSQYDQSKVKIVGLMTMGKIRTDSFEEDASLSFSKLREIKNELDNELKNDLKLSMGMSRDYEIAVREGAHFVRVGSTLFK